MKNIKVGLSISLTGNYSAQGVESFEGTKLWVSEVNNSGGLFVKEYNTKLPIELIHYDDESSVDKCRINIAKLISNNKVDIVLGPYSSSLALAACEIAQHYNKTLWNHGGSTDEVEERNFTTVINAITPASKYSHGIIESVKKADPHLGKIASFSAQDSGFSTRVAYGAKTYAEKLGLEVKEFKFASGLADFSDHINDLLDYEPDLVLGMGRAKDDLNLARHLFERNLEYKSMAFIVASIKLFKEKFGDKSEGILSSGQWEKGIQIEPEIGPTPIEFASHFRTEYSKEPDYVAAQGYNIGLILEKCIQETGTVEDITLRQYAKSTNLKTFYGNFKTDEGGNQIGHQMVVVQWQNGEKVIVFPESFAQADIIYPR